MRQNWHSLREYQALRAIMESGTTTSAARRLGISQSAVSRSLSSLEARTGNALFVREAGRLEPTQAAVRLNGQLDDLFMALEQINKETSPAKETLKLIAPPTYAHGLLVGHIASFSKANKNFLVNLEFGPTDDVISGVLDRRYELGVVGVELSRAGLKLLPFRQSSAVCVMPRHHPLASLDAIEPAHLHEQDLIALSPRHQRRRQLEKIIHDAGARPNITAEVSTSVAAVELTRLNLGLSVISPFPAVVNHSEEIVVRRFKSPIRYRTYFVLSDQGPVSRIANAFMRHVRCFTKPDAFSETL